MDHIWTAEKKSSEAMILAVMNAIFAMSKEAWKIQDLNGVWTRDHAIPVRRSNQLSYEATDVGSWSFVGSNVPVRNESTMKWYMKWIIFELRRRNQVKLWSSQLWTQFLHCVHNCEDHRFTWFLLRSSYMIHFIYHFINDKIICQRNKIPVSSRITS